MIGERRKNAAGAAAGIVCVFDMCLDAERNGSNNLCTKLAEMCVRGGEILSLVTA